MDACMQLFSSVNCNTARVNIIVLSVIFPAKTKRGWSCVKWGWRALLCDINQLFMPMKLQNVYLASWYTWQRHRKTNRRLYQRIMVVNSWVERLCTITRGRWACLVRELWGKLAIDWQMHIKQTAHYPNSHSLYWHFWYWHYTEARESYRVYCIYYIWNPTFVLKL